MILFLLQVAGLAAGFLAVRFDAARARDREGAPFLPATLAWALTYGVLSVCLAVASKKAPDAALALPFSEIAVFSLTGWAACLAGSSLGRWVYRESEIAAGQTA
jgi:hypothetical protein